MTRARLVALMRSLGDRVDRGVTEMCPGSARRLCRGQILTSTRGRSDHPDPERSRERWDSERRKTAQLRAAPRTRRRCTRARRSACHVVRVAGATAEIALGTDPLRRWRWMLGNVWFPIRSCAVAASPSTRMDRYNLTIVVAARAHESGPMDIEWLFPSSSYLVIDLAALVRRQSRTTDGNSSSSSPVPRDWSRTEVMHRP